MDNPLDAGGELIASFGEAKLIKLFGKTGSRYILTGGSEGDRAEAENWIFMFMKGATIDRTS